MRERVLEALANDGFLLDKEAEEFILDRPSPLNFAREHIALMAHRPLVITMRDLRTVCIMDDGPRLSPEPTNAGLEREFRRIGDVRIVKDITSTSSCLATPEGFARLIQDRYDVIKRILMRRRDMAGTLTIQRALDTNRMMNEKELKVIGIVNESKETRGGDRILEIEDGTGKCTVMIPRDDKLANDSVLVDEVIGVVGRSRRKDKKIMAKEIIRPDIPFSSGMDRTDSTAQVGFLSDVHVGSNTFLGDRWNDMVQWLNDEHKRLDLRYLVISGDCVDGIGIFPGQEEELDIDDILDQYKAFAECLKDIPDDIRLIVQPGNHDAVRPAEPQPALADEVARMFDSNTILIGNPAYLEIEGRTVLTYHGKSFDDLVAGIKGMSYSKPLKIMEEMLKRRHLAPIYGGKTPLAPESRDFLVIDEVPDIFVTGHVHGAGVSFYNGVRMINASTWQDQTSFQKMHNFVPDPAKMTLVHLGHGKPAVADF